MTFPDKQHAVLTEINERLKKADYGEDYIPVDLESMLMTNLELNVTFSQEIKVTYDAQWNINRNVLLMENFVKLFL